MLYKIISVAMRILGNSAYMIISGAFFKFKVIFFLTGIRLMITNSAKIVWKMIEK